MNIDGNSLGDLVQTVLLIATTVITSYKGARLAKKHAAKQSILQMIMEDQFNWELFRKFPVNYGNIQDEYKVYHGCGGNGEVTKKVKTYNEWYETNEKHMLEMKGVSCTPKVTLTCEAEK